MEQKVWTKAEILDLVATNVTFTGRCLQKLYARQTTDEQESRTTHHSNGRGFNAIDAEVMTGIAIWYREKGFLTSKQLLVVRRKLTKYVGQLLEEANPIS